MKRTVILTAKIPYEINSDDFDDSYGGVESFEEAVKMDQKQATDDPYDFLVTTIDGHQEMTITVELSDPDSDN